jgi:hypothetical protein
MNDPLPSNDPRLNYVSQTKTAVDYAYYDMPGGATIVLTDASSGEPLLSGSTALFSGGTGKSSYDFPPGTRAGTYYLAARDAAGDAVIAQTVEFTIANAEHA